MNRFNSNKQIQILKIRSLISAEFKEKPYTVVFLYTRITVLTFYLVFKNVVCIIQSQIRSFFANKVVNRVEARKSWFKEISI